MTRVSARKCLSDRDACRKAGCGKHRPPRLWTGKCWPVVAPRSGNYSGYCGETKTKDDFYASNLYRCKSCCIRKSKVTVECPVQGNTCLGQMYLESSSCRNCSGYSRLVDRQCLYCKKQFHPRNSSELWCKDTACLTARALEYRVQPLECPWCHEVSAPPHKNYKFGVGHAQCYYASLRVKRGGLSSKDQSFNDNSKKRCKSPELYVDDIEQEVVWERDGYICQICYNPVDKSLPWHDAWSAVTDHIIMLFEWGEHSYANVRLAHNKCNKARKKKRDETPGEMTNRHSKKPTNRHNEKQEQAKGIAIAGT